MPGAAIVVEELERHFGEVRAVDGVSIEVAPGEVYGFLGPNGAGKTTVVRMLITLLSPTGGRARVAGFDVVAEPHEVRLRIGAALQEAALDDKQSGVELLRLQGRLYGLRSAEIDQRLTDVSALIDIGDAMDRRVGTYSGGMKRRLDLAAALMHNPDVLFLDEPTTGLDPVSRSKVWEEVRRLNTELGMTIFLTTQYLEEADELTDRVGIISSGKLVAEGSPAELKRSIGTDIIVAKVEEHDEAITVVSAIDGVGHIEGTGDELHIAAGDGAAVIGRVAIALHDADIHVHELTLRTPTLDDVFFEVTGAHIESEDAVGGAV